MTPSLQLWQLRGDRALEARQAFVGDGEFPVEFAKSVGHSWRKAGDAVIQVRSSGKFQGHRKFRGVLCDRLPGTG